MYFTPIILVVLKSFWYLVPLFVLAMLLKSPWFKGVMGEVLVNIVLKYRLPKDTYNLLKNVTLPTSDGSTQIDHILISRYGIFAIETKNMKGWIFGSESQKQWTQQIFKHKSKFQNPLHQNYKHTRVLADCLDIDHDNIFSLIVFVGDSVFKTKVPDNVVYAGDIPRFVKSKEETIFSEREVSGMVEAVGAGRLKPSLKTNRDHVKHVREIKERKSSEKSCPKCGNAMTMRKAKSGANAGNNFWGCSQFPKCRSIVPV
ncbi:MAG: NERD domain-containing protein [Pseudomonadales bacterium]